MGGCAAVGASACASCNQESTWVAQLAAQHLNSRPSHRGHACTSPTAQHETHLQRVALNGKRREHCRHQLGHRRAVGDEDISPQAQQCVDGDGGDLRWWVGGGRVREMGQHGITPCPPSRPPHGNTCAWRQPCTCTIQAGARPGGRRPAGPLSTSRPASLPTPRPAHLDGQLLSQQGGRAHCGHHHRQQVHRNSVVCRGEDGERMCSIEPCTGTGWGQREQGQGHPLARLRALRHAGAHEAHTHGLTPAPTPGRWLATQQRSRPGQRTRQAHAACEVRRHNEVEDVVGHFGDGGGHPLPPLEDGEVVDFGDERGLLVLGDLGAGVGPVGGGDLAALRGC